MATDDTAASVSIEEGARDSNKILFSFDACRMRWRCSDRLDAYGRAERDGCSRSPVASECAAYGAWWYVKLHFGTRLVPAPCQTIAEALHAALPSRARILASRHPASGSPHRQY